MGVRDGKCMHVFSRCVAWKGVRSIVNCLVFGSWARIDTWRRVHEEHARVVRGKGGCYGLWTLSAVIALGERQKVAAGDRAMLWESGAAWLGDGVEGLVRDSYEGQLHPRNTRALTSKSMPAGDLRSRMSSTGVPTGPGVGPKIQDRGCNWMGAVERDVGITKDELCKFFVREI